MHYYEVAPNRIVRSGQDTFTYSSDDELSIGSVVEVPVGGRQLHGVVMDNANKPDYEVKPVTKLLSHRAIPKALLASYRWIAEYYHTPLATVLQTALPRGIDKKRRQTDPNTTQQHTRKRTKNVFTASQSTAIKQIESASSGTVMLHGITGSGKTLVYIEAAKSAIASGRSIIILVPEIALTSQLVAEFQQHFDDVLLAHSSLTEAQRHSVWNEALNSDRPRVVVGPRSALFLPLQSIGLIVIDECHEPSFKQDQSPRYSALRLASTLAQLHNARLILGSATPNVSDYYLAQQAGRPIITMDELAVAGSVRPTVQLVDMTKRTSFTRHRFLSDALLRSIASTLAQDNQALIFHNRRGSAPSTLCESCGWQAGCARCFVPLTLHGDQHKLICHVCGTTSRVPTSCPECSHADVIHRGIGTKLIESELKKLFPKARIARFDSDTDVKATVDRRYSELYDGSIDIIIGTQVIAKGLDLPHLRTVGVVQADAGLSLPDYASPERTFQLLSQVVGRVGRTTHPTSVIVQSYQPAHPAVRDGIAQNYSDFYERTIKLREHTNFPPFSFLLKLTCVYKSEAAAVRNARSLATKLRSLDKDIEILGPTPAFYERVRDTYRWQLVVKSRRRQHLVDLLDHLPPKNWQFELDPPSLL